MLLDIVGISDFWATAALGFVESLSRRMPGGQPQHKAVISGVLDVLSMDPIAKRAIAARNIRPPITKLDAVEIFLDMLRQIDPANTLRHQDVVRALILLDSEDSEVSTLAYSWLQGADVDEARRRELKFVTALPRPVRARSRHALDHESGGTHLDRCRSDRFDRQRSQHPRPVRKVTAGRTALA